MRTGAIPSALDLIDRLGAGTVAELAGGRDRGTADPGRLGRPSGGPGRPVGRRAVFFHSKGPGCYRCHQVEGRGGQAGPDLTTLAAATDRRRLVESIVAPSREIAPQFVSWNVARTDGTVFTGILLEQSPDGTLVFADSEGRRIGVKREEIAERKPQETSIMPEDVARTMTMQELRDLLAFLGRRVPASARSRHIERSRPCLYGGPQPVLAEN